MLAYQPRMLYSISGKQEIRKNIVSIMCRLVFKRQEFGIDFMVLT